MALVTNNKEKTIEKQVTEVVWADAPANLASDTIFYKVNGQEQPKTEWIASLQGRYEGLYIGQKITFWEDDSTSTDSPIFKIVDFNYYQDPDTAEYYTNIIYENANDDTSVSSGTINVTDENAGDYVRVGQSVYYLSSLTSATAEAPVSIKDPMTWEGYKDIDYEKSDHTISDYSVFDDVKDTKPFANSTAKLKFFAKTPGDWGNSIRISIANPDDFEKGKYINEGVPLDNYFDYLPYGDQFAVIVSYDGDVVEQFICSFGELDKNEKYEYTFVETMINQKSDYILVKVNDNLEAKVASLLFEPYTDNNGDIQYKDNTISLCYGNDESPSKQDIWDGYQLFDNKEEIDVDIILANENYPTAASAIAMSREDCIAFIGAPRSCSVGLNATTANQMTINFRKNTLNIDSKFVALFNNYKYQYCNELGTYKWVNLVGDICGLKAQTNYNYKNWYAAAGLNRGKVLFCEKLAYSPTNAMRDSLYKAGINPIYNDPNVGAIVFGNKTLQTKASSFDRINVVSLFNHLGRTLGNMSKYSLFEFNDSYTRNYIVSLIKPYLGVVKAGRGIQDYMVICDETNNTPDVIANNQLIIDVAIKPTYVAEFIYLRFTNAGTNDFSVIVTSALTA